MTKLCDLGNDDSVCSVGWAQRGTHLAVGTSNGKLQVYLSNNKTQCLLAVESVLYMLEEYYLVEYFVFWVVRFVQHGMSHLTQNGYFHLQPECS